ncbi:MAG: hypothetical protein ACFFBJ_07890 [Promethearchaeota archaeon]|jgi:hypothetical protein
MVYAEQRVQWISADAGVTSDWSPGGHRTGQLVSETAYLVTNL